MSDGWLARNRIVFGAPYLGVGRVQCPERNAWATRDNEPLVQGFDGSRIEFTALRQTLRLEAEDTSVGASLEVEHGATRHGTYLAIDGARIEADHSKEGLMLGHPPAVVVSHSLERVAVGCDDGEQHTGATLAEGLVVVEVVLHVGMPEELKNSILGPVGERRSEFAVAKKSCEWCSRKRAVVTKARQSCQRCAFGTDEDNTVMCSDREVDRRARRESISGVAESVDVDTVFGAGRHGCGKDMRTMGGRSSVERGQGQGSVVPARRSIKRPWSLSLDSTE
ncbi:MAG: hypothetical protein NXI35_25655 [bacterium]|nr:hypothetical protein [bacterium]